MKNSLLEKLTEYVDTTTPFHMPGHKRSFRRGVIPYGIDITEVDGFDNLHELGGVLKDTADLAKTLYSSRESFPLVNGSTCGVLAGIYSLTRENKNILIARNCHKSVYNAAEILELDTYYITPEMQNFGIWGKVSPEQVEEKIKEHNIGTVVITSPTYDGVISDVSSIYEVCKKYGAYLFVDCAHGAHLFDLHHDCDISVMSLHKTLPSLTQTAILNVNSARVDTDVVRHGLSVFETSSPSYILLASIDECLRFLIENKDSFDTFYENLKEFYEETKKLKNIKVTHFDDMGKIIMISSDGQMLSRLLRKEKIEVEMASQKYALAIATICDTKESLKKLSDALFRIDVKSESAKTSKKSDFTIPEKAISISSALREKGKFLDICDCEGKISLEYIWAYPPGAPIVVPGEVMTKEIIEYIKDRKELKSTKDKYPKIYVK